MSKRAETGAGGVRVPGWLYRATWMIVQPLLWLLTGWRVTGREHVPTSGGVLLVSNHLNNADPVLLYMALPRPICFMAKKELFRNRLFAAGIRAWGTFPVDRGAADRQAIKQALDLMAAGSMVGMFPEGTRSRSHALAAAHPGLGLLIARSGVPVVPVAITGSERLLRLWPRPALTVTIGRPLRFTPPPGGRLDHQAAVDDVMVEIARMLPPAYRGTYAARAAQPRVEALRTATDEEAQARP
jgi:1-acyl-sn-glycerol-3-phosphate acyltransferase